MAAFFSAPSDVIPVGKDEPVRFLHFSKHHKICQIG